MATATFSWAQVAKGNAQTAPSQTPPSKVTSGTASPANGALTDISVGGSWADDVEASAGSTASESTVKAQEESRLSQLKEDAVEHAKADDRKEEVTSGISSPDLAASASTNTKEDDEASALNGTSSESTWDAKSQTSEPAWIADRKERQQNGAQSTEKPSTGEKQSQESTPQIPKQPVLQEAAPPSFNVWQQRMESQKAKTAAQPKSSPVIPTTQFTSQREKQRPQTGTRRKANSMTGVPRETIGVNSEEVNKFFESKPAAGESRTDSPLTGPGKATSTDRESEHAPPAPLPTMKDVNDWPTPEIGPEKERKFSAEKGSDGQRNEDVTPTVKRGKTQWAPIPLPVTPNTFRSEYKESKPRGPSNSDRSNRNGNGPKGRGGHRGASNPSGDRDRENARSNSTPTNGEGVISTKESIPGASDVNVITAPSKPSRASSSSPRGQQKKDSFTGRRTSRQTTGEAVQSESNQGRATASKDASFSRPFHDLRRTKSPTKMNDLEDKFPEEFVPTPIPRQNTNGTQTEDVADNVASSTPEAPPTRSGQFDSRKESRNGEGVRDPNYQAPRGGKRGGRGRGGNTPRDFTNGHPTFGAPSNGYGTEFPAASPYGVAQSPILPASRGNHQLSYPPPRGWRGIHRSQSIPVDNFYNQNPRAGYPGGHHAVHGIQTFVPNMYDISGYPMSAMPYSPHMESENLMELVRAQVDYYFSIENLIKDMFLRKHMDSKGFVFLEIIANFNRIKQLTQDRDIVKAVCMSSSVIEIGTGEDGRERLRKREGWDQFTLPMEQRESSAQTEGPERLDRPQPPQLSLNGIPPQYRGPASAGLPSMHHQINRRSYDSSYPMVNGYPHQFTAYPGYAETMYAESMNGDEPRGRAAKSPIHENVITPTEQPIATALGISKSEEDSFPDDQVNVLTVVVKALREEKAPPYHSLASRTFSNGSIDSRSIMSEITTPSESKATAPTNGEPMVNGGEHKLNLTRTLSPSKPNPNDRGTPSPDMNVFWVKDQDYSMKNLSEDLTPEPYYQLRERALDDRSRAVTGNCPYDLDILYQFWSHFLLRNFNNNMYSEFKHCANDDAKNRFSFTGLNNLIQYYFQSLSSHHPIRDRVVKDYVELVKSQPAKMEGAAFKTLRSAWRNGALNLKNRKKLADTLDAQLKLDLDRSDI